MIASTDPATGSKSTYRPPHANAAKVPRLGSRYGIVSHDGRWKNGPKLDACTFQVSRSPPEMQEVQNESLAHQLKSGEQNQGYAGHVNHNVHTVVVVGTILYEATLAFNQLR
jgi:hypothetical protein